MSPLMSPDAKLVRETGYGRRKGAGRGLRLMLIALGALLLAFAALATFRTGAPVTIEIEPALPGIGPATPVTARVATTGRGLAGVRLELVQGETRRVLAERRHVPRRPWELWGERRTEDELTVEVGSRTVDGLAVGEATVRAVAERAGTWLRGPDPSVAEVTLPVRLAPPSLSVLSGQHNVQQGGSGLIVYRAGGGTVKSGVEAGEEWFPGFPLPGTAGGDGGGGADGGGGERFALFALPFDLADPAAIRLVAEDELGNRVERAFLDTFQPRPFAEGTIELSDGFLTSVVPEIVANSPGFSDRGDLLSNYLAINGEMRRQNRARLVELAAESRPEKLWNGAFVAMPNGQVMSPFAVRRTYRYEGREVDEQFHLGFDLASVRRTPVPASAAGVVMVAEYMGIYGNVVILDHGYGLMSLYGHLSSIDVAAGERVEQGQTLGRTGETGLAGGDHLHFGILLGGLPVTPVEWWDPRWVRERIESRLKGPL